MERNIRVIEIEAKKGGALRLGYADGANRIIGKVVGFDAHGRPLVQRRLHDGGVFCLPIEWNALYEEYPPLSKGINKRGRARFR